ncbi:hypothetical protein OPT61_g3773 [Boeremia exigua]|uniref:Uncharacterized protein n=1 Tax=Boeremia exigua TaxID=749465 RepID=A0ACC2IGK8_9PLEO|nr:hypothetical protein OPT61_g3773 [Boeremia exigua]
MSSSQNPNQGDHHGLQSPLPSASTSTMSCTPSSVPETTGTAIAMFTQQLESEFWSGPAPSLVPQLNYG